MYTVSVDNLIFGCRDGGLEVCLIQHASGPAAGLWGLPGDWIQNGESLEDAAIRTLRTRTGIGDLFLEQLHTFSALDRYPNQPRDNHGLLRFGSPAGFTPQSQARMSSMLVGSWYLICRT